MHGYVPTKRMHPQIQQPVICSWARRMGESTGNAVGCAAPGQIALNGQCPPPGSCRLPGGASWPAIWSIWSLKEATHRSRWDTIDINRSDSSGWQGKHYSHCLGPRLPHKLPRHML